MGGEGLDAMYVLEAVAVIIGIVTFGGSSAWYFIKREKAAVKRDVQHKNDMEKIANNYAALTTSQETLQSTIAAHLLASERAEGRLNELSSDVKDHEARIRALEKHAVRLPGAQGTELETETIGDALESLRKRVDHMERQGGQTRLAPF